jgi:hypothetical protein
MRSLITALVAGSYLVAMPTIAEDASTAIQVQEAQGQAAVLAGDKPAAREKAIADALRQSVQMAVGTQVTSSTQVENFQTKLDQVLTRSAGYVRKYSILKEAMDGDVVQITIRAEVSLGALDKDLEAMGMLMQQKGMPRTMVLMAEENIGMVAPMGPWMAGKNESALMATDLRIGESIVLDELRKNGFRQLIDPEIAESKTASVGGIATSLTAVQARKLGTLTHAEVIIIGQVIATSRGTAGELGPEWKSCVATMTARAVNTDNGDILATSEATQPAAQLDDLTCGKEAIKKAAKLFSADMTKKIAARWSSDISGGSEVHVTVKNVDSLKQAGELKAGITNFVRGVKAVSSRGFNDGVAEFDVTLVGSTENFAQELEAKKLGKFSLKVKGVTANTVVAEIGK